MKTETETTSKDIAEIKEAIGGTLAKGGGLRARIQRMEITFAVWISLSGITLYLAAKFEKNTRKMIREELAPLRNDIAELRKALEPHNKPKDEKSQ